MAVVIRSALAIVLFLAATEAAAWTCVGAGKAVQWDGKQWLCATMPTAEPGPAGPPGQPGSSYRTIETSTTPCVQGDSTFDQDFIYLCVTPNAWIRIPLATRGKW